MVSPPLKPQASNAWQTWGGCKAAALFLGWIRGAQQERASPPGPHKSVRPRLRVAGWGRRDRVGRPQWTGLGGAQRWDPQISMGVKPCSALTCPLQRETQRDRKRQRERRVEGAPHFLEMGKGGFAQTRGRPPIIVLGQKEDGTSRSREGAPRWGKTLQAAESLQGLYPRVE